MWHPHKHRSRHILGMGRAGRSRDYEMPIQMARSPHITFLASWVASDSHLLPLFSMQRKCWGHGSAVTHIAGTVPDLHGSVNTSYPRY